MWLELLNQIKTAIEESDFSGSVKLGFLNPQNAGIDSNGMVFLGRGECGPIDELVHNTLKQEFYVEVWTRVDSADFEEGYDIISELELEVEKILGQFREQCGALNADVCVLQDSGFQIIDIHCTNKVDDHDSMRPFIGTQYRFEARLYDLKEDTKGGIY